MGIAMTDKNETIRTQQEVKKVLSRVEMKSFV